MDSVTILGEEAIVDTEEDKEDIPPIKRNFSMLNSSIPSAKKDKKSTFQNTYRSGIEDVDSSSRGIDYEGDVCDGDEDEFSIEKNEGPLDPNWWRVAASPNTVFPFDPRCLPFPNKSCSMEEAQTVMEAGNKIAVLMTIIALSMNESDKVLVFSQSLPNLDLMELVLQSSYWGELSGVEPCQALKTKGVLFKNWKKDSQFMRIDGAVSERQKLIDRFNKPESPQKVFLISTKAGNMGINLQAANRVVLFDSSLNPVHDLQAIYRAYRYGQKKDVYVYRLLSRGSMEEKIYRSQVCML